MKKMKKILSSILVASMAMSLAACGSSSDEGVYHIGICQQLEHEALDAATKGFQDALIEKLGKDTVASWDEIHQIIVDIGEIRQKTKSNLNIHFLWVYEFACTTVLYD